MRHVPALLLFVAVQAHANAIAGIVVEIADGDTANILDAADTKRRIRLAGIDAPERNQPFGKASTRRLAKDAARHPIQGLTQGQTSELLAGVSRNG